MTRPSTPTLPTLQADQLVTVMGGTRKHVQSREPMHDSITAVHIVAHRV